VRLGCRISNLIINYQINLLTMDSKWTTEKETEAVKNLTDDASINKDRRYYDVR